jgi:gliding motility-associated-like protein
VSNDTNPSFILDMGTYEIKHIVVNDKGCIDSVKQTVTVNEVPKTNFRAPKACLDDPTASFTNLTPYFSPGKIFNFLWDFGDPGSLDNTSTNENPFHRYNTKGDKEALLTVTDPVTGCDSTKAIKFTINGVNPKAAFDILSFCSNKEVILKNMSKVVDGGQVVKVELYWEPLQDTTDDEPKVGSLYQYKYPLVTMPNPTTAYNIRYIAYSGLTCRDILDTTISILASPLVQFDPLRSICQEKVDTLITATETTTINGTGVFSGTGVTTLSSTSAEFQPGAAGPGKHKISYTFSADNGCVDTASRIITVNPTPTKVSAGGDATGKVYMLEEDSVVLKGKASGQGLTYLWVPAAYMNNNKLDTPKVSPTDDQVYTFTATTDSGCKASSSVTVVVLKKIIVPNAFTPNGDGINDYWMITPLNIYPDATVQVYTRYGQLVFESRGYGSAWDGTYNGKPLPIATYYWVIDPKRRKPINGTVSIIR